MLKLTQLIFPKIDDNKSCMSAIVIILNCFEIDPSLLCCPLDPKCTFQYQSHRLISFKSAKNSTVVEDWVLNVDVPNLDLQLASKYSFTSHDELVISLYNKQACFIYFTSLVFVQHSLVDDNFKPKVHIPRIYLVHTILTTVYFWDYPMHDNVLPRCCSFDSRQVEGRFVLVKNEDKSMISRPSYWKRL